MKQQLVHPDRDEAFLVRHFLARVELEIPFPPVEQLFQQLAGMDPQRFEQAGPGDESTLDQEVDQPLAGSRLLFRSPGEIGVLEHAGLHQLRVAFELMRH